MVTRRTNRTVMHVTSNSGRDYLVTLEHLKNNAYGNPCFEACITSLATEDHFKNYYCGAVYRFTGHYFGDEKECKWVVEYHEENYIHNYEHDCDKAVNKMCSEVKNND